MDSVGNWRSITVPAKVEALTKENAALKARVAELEGKVNYLLVLGECLVIMLKQRSEVPLHLLMIVSSM